MIDTVLQGFYIAIVRKNGLMTEMVVSTEMVMILPKRNLLLNWILKYCCYSSVYKVSLCLYSV